jgi:hypothetical protein
MVVPGFARQLQPRRGQWGLFLDPGSMEKRAEMHHQTLEMPDPALKGGQAGDQELAHLVRQP